MQLCKSKLIHTRQSLTPTIYVGATGTFYSDPLVDGCANLPPRQATGTITHIKEGPNFAVFAVKQANGEVVLLRR